MIKRIAIIFGLAISFAGCAKTVYTHSGKQYSTKESFLNAVDENIAAGLATVVPLAAPLSGKTLIFGLPSALAFSAMDIETHVKNKKQQPADIEINRNRDVNEANFKDIKIFSDAIKKRNIYTSTKFVEMDSTTGSLVPSPDADTLYFYSQGPGTQQWFYSSAKNGKQIFAYDRSSAESKERLNAFLQAVQVQALQNQ